MSRPISSPEERLVLTATQPIPVHPSTEVPFPDADADEALRIARRNKVVSHLSHFVAQHVDDEARSRWAGAIDLAKRYAHRARSQHTETVAILTDLFTHGMQACPLKGTFLSLDLYGDITRRQSADIDILVCPEHFADAVALLHQRGYRLMRPRALPDRTRLHLLLDASRQYNIALVDEQRRFCVELHWQLTNFRIFPGERKNQLWERFGTRIVDGARTACLGGGDLMLYMAVHGTKDYWRRLSWLTDFAHFAVHHPDAVEAARSEAARSQLRVVWEASCALADMHYGTSLHVAPQSRAQRERVRFVVDHVRLFRPDFSAPSHETFAYEWNARDNWRGSIRRTIEELVTPNYAGAGSEADYHPGMQRRRRAARGLRKLLTAS